MQRYVLPTLLVSVVLTTGCLSLSTTEEREYGNLIAEGYISGPIRHKNPATTAVIDFIIPGLGHLFYLRDDSGAALFLSNVFWPLSAFWGAYAGNLDTQVHNRRHTIEYYLYGAGKQEIEQKQLQKLHEMALQFLQLQAQRGRTEVPRLDVTDALMLSGVTPDRLTQLDWAELERRSGLTLPVRLIRPQAPSDLEPDLAE